MCSCALYIHGRYQRITAHTLGAIKLRGPRSTVLPAQDLINDLLNPNPQERLGSHNGRLPELQAHAFFGDLDWQSLSEAKLPSPLAPICDLIMLQVCPPQGGGVIQANPEEGIATEPCWNWELEDTAEEAERFEMCKV